jgi:spoIIIJ-associated protein
METYEFEGRTTEEALESASRELNVPVEELDFDIVEPGSAGIFGLVGGKKAKIRITLSGTTSSEEEEAKEDGLPMAEEDGLPMAEEDGLPIAKEALEKILALIPVETHVSAKWSDEPGDGLITLNIEGDKSGLLIGRNGKTLDALQFIVNKIVNKTLGKKVRVVVDSENYRQRKIESLTQLAFKLGDKAKRLKKPVTTNPLNPHDRRIVHLALKEDEKLDTRSRGEGPLKKIVIMPKN